MNSQAIKTFKDSREIRSDFINKTVERKKIRENRWIASLFCNIREGVLLSENRPTRELLPYKVTLFRVLKHHWLNNQKSDIGEKR